MKQKILSITSQWLALSQAERVEILYVSFVQALLLSIFFAALIFSQWPIHSPILYSLFFALWAAFSVMNGAYKLMHKE